ncbi:MAG: hypothetical protein K6F97_06280 [Lachnospiraceae bacterium]|nr:hypothetical protein [Lachnospiraceae bacterium]
MKNEIELIAVIGICLFIIFVMVILPIVLTIRYNKATKKNTKKNTKKHIRFDTPYCNFGLEERGEIGYEGAIEWEYNSGIDKNCDLFFETDNLVTPPEEGYAEYAMANLSPDEAAATDLEIEKLVQIIPRFEEIRPGKCYRKLESILSDRKRIDTEIREYIVDYFLFKPELIDEKFNRQEMIDGVEISAITVYREGVTEYSIYCTKGIYAEDIIMVVKEDGTRDIQYATI